MHEDAVVAVFSTLEEARRAVARLDKVGWNSDVSLITRGKESELDATSLVDQSDQMEKSAAIGAAAGVAIGLLASSALLIIPGSAPSCSSAPWPAESPAAWWADWSAP